MKLGIIALLLWLGVAIPTKALPLTNQTESAETSLELLQFLQIQQNIESILEEDDDDDDDDPGEDPTDITPDAEYDVLEREKHVKARLYVNNGPKKGTLVRLMEIDSLYMNPDAPLVVITHGWMEYGGKAWLKKYVKRFQKTGEYNVMTVGWRRWAMDVRYCLSAHRTTFVGNYVGDVVSAMVQSSSVNLKNVYLIGFSLGGHVVGSAGKRVQYKLNDTVGRITGLDPAGPGFEYEFLGCKFGDDRSLRITDADFVDVIHSSKAFGTHRNLGHVDFFPNGGEFQPGCLGEAICNHLRAFQLYEATIGSFDYLSKQCSDWEAYVNGRCEANPTELLGPLASPKFRNKFFIKTCGILGTNPC